MFRHARLRDAIRPRWQLIASASGRGSIEVSWSKNDSIASTNPATGTYSPQPLYDRRPVATKQAPPPPTADEAARVAEFRVALRRFQRQTEVVARDCGITPAWYLLLLQIKGAPDLTEQTTVTALADRLQLAQSSVTELVSRAQHAGLLERTPSSADARVVHLRLSAQGRRSSPARSGVSPPSGKPSGRLSPTWTTEPAQPV